MSDINYNLSAQYNPAGQSSLGRALPPRNPDSLSSRLGISCSELLSLEHKLNDLLIRTRGSQPSTLNREDNSNKAPMPEANLNTRMSMISSSISRLIAQVDELGNIL